MNYTANAKCLQKWIKLGSKSLCPRCSTKNNFKLWKTDVKLVDAISII